MEAVEDFLLTSGQYQIFPAFALAHKKKKKTLVPNQSLPQAYP
jgi:hypothetical protein